MSDSEQPQDLPPRSAPARRRGSRQTPAVRRQDLLAVTINCLARLGPRATTGREICRQAGVSHGLLRHYFNNPEKLLLETYQDLCDRMIARFEEEMAAPHDDPWQTIDAFFAVLFSDTWANSDLLGAWIAFWTLVRSNDEFAQVSEDHNRRLRAMLVIAVSRLPVGAIKPDDLATLLSAVMDGLWLDFCLSPTRLPRERAMELGRIALRQLVPQPAVAA
ncbi:TetR family transcriptional regulator C-terminal domain-containing protein [soil metagenome]